MKQNVAERLAAKLSTNPSVADTDIVPNEKNDCAVAVLFTDGTLAESHSRLAVLYELRQRDITPLPHD